VGHAHFLTYFCHQRLPLLSTDRSRQWVIDAMSRVRISQHVELWAYVVMPEHVHVLLCPLDPDYEMKYILTALKRPVADAARAYLTESDEEVWLRRRSVTYPSRTVFRFWQPGGGYDRNVFRQYRLPQLVDYIHNNPVRRGLVSTPAEFNWSSARFWDGAVDVPIRMDAFEL